MMTVEVDIPSGVEPSSNDGGGGGNDGGDLSVKEINGESPLVVFAGW